MDVPREGSRAVPAGSVPPISGHRRGCVRDGSRAEHGGGSTASTGSCRGGLGGPPGRGGGGCGGGPAPGRSGLSPEGSGLSPLRPPRAGGSAAPSPPRRARTHLHIHNLICISTTSFAYKHFNICIDTPRRSPYLADVIPSRSPIGGRRAAGPPPYIGRAAGRLPRSALRPGGGTDQLQLPPPPPP